MKRIWFRPMVWVVALLLAMAYYYVEQRLVAESWARWLLAMPFFMIWIVPVVYWVGERHERSPFDACIHVLSYLSMGWVSFVVFFTLLRDALLFAALHAGHTVTFTNILAWGPTPWFWAPSLSLLAGVLNARRGPRVRTVPIAFSQMPSTWRGLRIAQVSDLHVGLTIRRDYVEKVARLIEDAEPDLIALTGDMVDGVVAELASEIAPLIAVARKFPTYFVLGNHEYYSGAGPWLEFLRGQGIVTLENEHVIVQHRDTKIMMAGVLDPAARFFSPDNPPDPAKAMGGAEAAAPLRILLAHNPKLAIEAEAAGFDLMLSGHTHGGQFIPWTWVTKLVHWNHFAGLSQQKGMRVYVSPGTGTWGPPIRLGTTPEVTLLQLQGKE